VAAPFSPFDVAHGALSDAEGRGHGIGVGAPLRDYSIC